MKCYTRTELLAILDCEEGFVLQLEQEEVILPDAQGDGGEDLYSERMLERIRVARNLIQELDVNLAGAAIIVRMREEIAELQRELARLLRR
jgi:MerR family transcriptional regulator, heat shock protein HspR